MIYKRTNLDGYILEDFDFIDENVNIVFDKSLKENDDKFITIFLELKKEEISNLYNNDFNKIIINKKTNIDNYKIYEIYKNKIKNKTSKIDKEFKNLKDEIVLEYSDDLYTDIDY